MMPWKYEIILFYSYPVHHSLLTRRHRLECGRIVGLAVEGNHGPRAISVACATPHTVLMESEGGFDHERSRFVKGSWRVYLSCCCAQIIQTGPGVERALELDRPADAGHHLVLAKEGDRVNFFNVGHKIVV